MAQRIHMSCDIAGFLKHMGRKRLDGVLTDNGVPLSHNAAKNRLYRMLSEGKKLIRMCEENECPDFDEFEKGCPGHEIPKEELEELNAEFEATRLPNPPGHKSMENKL